MLLFVCVVLAMIVTAGALLAYGNRRTMTKDNYTVKETTNTKLAYVTPIRRASMPYNRDNMPTNIPVTMEWRSYRVHLKDELISISSLAVHGVVTGVSYSFFVEHPLGSRQIFTEYYLEVYEVLRGETHASEIAVRLQGGITENYAHFVNNNPEFVIGREYILFLTIPTGADFDTLGYYYYLIAGGQSVFQQIDPLNGLESFPDEMDRYFIQYERVIPNVFNISDFRSEIARLYDTAPVPTAQDLRQKSAEGVRGNVERGVLVMSDKEFEELIDKILNSHMYPMARIVLAE